MESLTEISKRASKKTKNKTISTILRVVATTEKSAANYLVYFKSELIEEGVLNESDFIIKPSNAWDNILYDMQQTSRELYKNSFELMKSL